MFALVRVCMYACTRYVREGTGREIVFLPPLPWGHSRMSTYHGKVARYFLMIVVVEVLCFNSDLVAAATTTTTTTKNNNHLRSSQSTLQ